MLHDDRARRHLVAVAYIPDIEGNEVASMQLAIDTQVEESKLPSI